uniref:Uncharacterized protein n=1 Tax=Anguilla anguilla TaxID=7936 RepID=A0A0E9TZS9_ANGAN
MFFKNVFFNCWSTLPSEEPYECSAKLLIHCPI